MTGIVTILFQGAQQKYPKLTWKAFKKIGNEITGSMPAEGMSVIEMAKKLEEKIAEKFAKKMKNTYANKPEIVALLAQLVAIAAAKKHSMDVPQDFIDQHPWTLKYLSNFAEAKAFMEIAKHPKVEVEEIVPEPRHVAFRKKHNLAEVLTFRVTRPRCGGFDHSAEQYFRFDKQEDGTFLAVNG